MGTGYTRQSAAEIASGEIITDTDIEAEFDQLESFAHGTSGHSHDGTTGEGPKISLSTSISGRLPVANGGTGGIHKLNATTAPTINDDTTSNYVAGSIWVDVTNDIAYICVDASSGAAIWRKLLSGGQTDQTVTGGFIITPLSLGTLTTGTVTPDPGDRALQYATFNGALTLAPSTNTGKYSLQVTNGASAGTVTTSGWTKVVGSFTTTDGDDFICHATIHESFSLLEIIALQ